MVFHWSLSDSKSPQVSRTLLSILAVLSNAVIWIVSTRLPTSQSSRPFNNPLVIVPKAPIPIRKSPQVSRTLLSILAVLNNVVVWIVSTRPPTSKSSSPFSNPFVPNAPITIGIIVTFMFHSFFNSLTRSRDLSLFPLSFSFILGSTGTIKSTILQVLFFCRLV